MTCVKSSQFHFFKRINIPCTNKGDIEGQKSAEEWETRERSFSIGNFRIYYHLYYQRIDGKATIII